MRSPYSGPMVGLYCPLQKTQRGELRLLLGAGGRSTGGRSGVGGAMRRASQRPGPFQFLVILFITAMNMVMVVLIFLFLLQCLLLFL